MGTIPIKEVLLVASRWWLWSYWAICLALFAECVYKITKKSSNCGLGSVKTAKNGSIGDDFVKFWMKWGWNWGLFANLALRLTDEAACRGVGKGKCRWKLVCRWVGKGKRGQKVCCRRGGKGKRMLREGCRRVGAKEMVRREGCRQVGKQTFKEKLTCRRGGKEEWKLGHNFRWCGNFSIARCSGSVCYLSNLRFRAPTFTLVRLFVLTITQMLHLVMPYFSAASAVV